VPVVDIAEAAASTAMFMGHKYSVVTTLDRTVPLIEDRLKLAGLDARCLGPARIVHLEGPHLCPSAAEEDYRLAAGLTSDKPARLAARLLP
jgi:Asp/Glu/hydantoin racemase